MTEEQSLPGWAQPTQPPPERWVLILRNEDAGRADDKYQRLFYFGRVAAVEAAKRFRADGRRVVTIGSVAERRNVS